jgi:hypothetical protein
MSMHCKQKQANSGERCKGGREGERGRERKQCDAKKNCCSVARKGQRREIIHFYLNGEYEEQAL